MSDDKSLCPFARDELVCFADVPPKGMPQSLLDHYIGHHGKGPHLVAAVHPTFHRGTDQTVSVIGSIWAHTWFRLATEAERTTYVPRPLVGPK